MGSAELWVDRAVRGGGPSSAIATLDGLLPLLSTDDPRRAAGALAQLTDPSRYAGPFGLRYVDPAEPTYDPDSYWRGPAWPQLDLLGWLALRRWGVADDDAARAAVAGVTRSGFAEYRNPETGAGIGAVPQTWAAVAAAYRPTSPLRRLGGRDHV